MEELSDSEQRPRGEQPWKKKVTFLCDPTVNNQSLHDLNDEPTSVKLGEIRTTSSKQKQKISGFDFNWGLKNEDI